jgi:hypothetical protein
MVLIRRNKIYIRWKWPRCKRTSTNICQQYGIIFISKFQYLVYKQELWAYAWIFEKTLCILSSKKFKFCCSCLLCSRPWNTTIYIWAFSLYCNKQMWKTREITRSIFFKYGFWIKWLSSHITIIAIHSLTIVWLLFNF